MSITAPGKVILFGEHTVVYGCPALATAIDSRTSLTFHRISPNFRNDLLLKINFRDFTNEPLVLLHSNIIKDIPPEKEDADMRTYFLALSEKLLIEQRMTKSLINSLAVFLFSFFLMKKMKEVWNFTYPYEVTCSSSLPINAGLGSSGAFCSVVAAFFLYLGGELVDSALSASDRLRVQSFAHELEKFMHNSPSGIDTAISVSGGLLKFHRFDDKFNLREIEVFNPECLPNLIVINTGIPRSTATVVESVRAFRQEKSGIFDSVFESVQSICEVGTKTLSNPLDNTSLVILSSLFSSNHRELCRLGVSNALLDEIVRRMEVLGFGAKLTGAGRGGCVIAIKSRELDTADSVKVVRNALKDLNVTVFETSLCAPGIKLNLDTNF
nr:Mevalonate galactokinase [Hymenolepis microstoma]